MTTIVARATSRALASVTASTVSTVRPNRRVALSNARRSASDHLTRPTARRPAAVAALPARRPMGCASRRSACSRCRPHRLQQAEHLGRRACSSRLPVGSSASRSRGPFAIARAIATRCRSPPESAAGRWLRAIGEPDGVEQLSARAPPPSRDVPEAPARARRSRAPPAPGRDRSAGTRTRPSRGDKRPGRHLAASRASAHRPRRPLPAPARGLRAARAGCSSRRPTHP